jgi:hypothetical protein
MNLIQWHFIMSSILHFNIKIKIIWIVQFKKGRYFDMWIKEKMIGGSDQLF